MNNQVITIDGPSASGKGTVAKCVAKKLGFQYLDSGALYRIVAYCAYNQNIDFNDEKCLSALIPTLDISFMDDRIFCNNQEVSVQIRQEKIGMAASKIAALPLVRSCLLQRQRDFSLCNHLVTDGRDMGSVVFPNAQLKIFLTANADIRAQRRAKQLNIIENSNEWHAILNDIQQRDQLDTTRLIAPLKPCPDAYFLDTSALSIDAAVNQIIQWYEKVCFSSSS